MSRDRQRFFPAVPARMVGALAEQPIELDGMKLVFDERVTLLPVEAEVEQIGRPDEDARADRRGR